MLSARIVGAVAAAVSAASICLLIAAAAGASLVPALITIAALALTPAIVDVHLSALSEPLFLALLSVTLLAIVMRPSQPALAGLAAAGAALVRYAGVAVVGGVVLWAFMQRDSLRGRVRRALVAAAPAVTLQGLWVIRSRLVAGPHGIREAGIYGGFGATLDMGRHTIIDWLVPLPYGETLPLRGAIALILLVALAFVLAAGARQARRDAVRDPRVETNDAATVTMRACGLLALCYVGVITLSRLFADPGIPFDNRILAPLELLVGVAAAVAMTLWWRGRGLMPRAVLAALLLGWVSLAIYADYDTVSYAMSEGADFASSQWRESPTIAWARAHGGNVPLYSNWAAAVYFHLHRTARELPEADDSSAFAAFADTLRSRHALVLAFDAPSPGLADPISLERLLSLREVAKLSDGRILAAPDDTVKTTTPR
jgi:hypothetical protein